jgi:transcription elongation factor S-II
VVKRLRKHKSKDIVESSTKLRKFWKQQGLTEGEDSPHTSRLSDSHTSENSGTTSIGTKNELATSAKSSGSSGTAEAKKEAPPYPVTTTGHKKRDSMRDWLFESLTEDFPNNDKEKARMIAVDIETCMWEKFEETPQYKEKYLELAYTLKDPANDELRDALFLGDLNGESVVNANPDDLAPSVVKEKRKLAFEELVAQRKPDVLKGCKGLFKCGKCKGDNCSYYQVQTRGADEPMTVFIQCVTCGHRWRQ